MFTSSRKRYAPHPSRLSVSHRANPPIQYELAKRAYKRVLEHDPNHAKVLQQLGWLYHQENNSYQSQEEAIEYLEKSVKAGKYPSPHRI